MEISQWTKSHFIAYIFLSIADADENMDKNEILSMQEFLKHLNVTIDNTSELLASVREVHKRHSDDLRINFIATKHQQFLTCDDEMINIMDKMEDLILADNNIDRSEIKIYARIRKALDIED